METVALYLLLMLAGAAITLVVRAFWNATQSRKREADIRMTQLAEKVARRVVQTHREWASHHTVADIKRIVETVAKSNPEWFRSEARTPEYWRDIKTQIDMAMRRHLNQYHGVVSGPKETDQ